jgi:hypothetical protein
MWTQNISNRANKSKQKSFGFTALRHEMLGLQAVQKGNGVCVDTKPASTPFSSRLETVLKLLQQKWRFQTISRRLIGGVVLVTCILYAGLQINIWLHRTFVLSLLILVGHNLNLVGQKPTSLNLVGHIYVTRYI